jgi:hypothetical protein
VYGEALSVQVARLFGEERTSWFTLKSPAPADISRRKRDSNVADSYCTRMEGQEFIGILGEGGKSGAIHEKDLARIRHLGVEELLLSHFL